MAAAQHATVLEVGDTWREAWWHRLSNEDLVERAISRFDGRTRRSSRRPRAG
ncbi:hypothetical protein [Streptomyces sp. NBC_00233]|uniref:hypothetical protein n=1 Tax=Streptomyces sp. NBC_00233 TaxID=2975686 RepID=UPI00225A1BD9|nr:hypothetical protein [Streptomyces sp. NBC_00233]MCX5232669.1 hypothetical protein [Streptomyces sp. NBC_00233]